MGYEGIRGRTGARAWEVIHIYTGSFTPSPDPTPFYRRLISTRKGGLTTNGIHLLIPASLSNRSGPPQLKGPPIKFSMYAVSDSERPRLVVMLVYLFDVDGLDRPFAVHDIDGSLGKRR